MKERFIVNFLPPFRIYYFVSLTLFFNYESNSIEIAKQQIFFGNT